MISRQRARNKAVSLEKADKVRVRDALLRNAMQGQKAHALCEAGASVLKTNI